MNKKNTQQRAHILQLLVEGNSLRSTARIADCSINTVMKLLRLAGDACAAYQDKHLRNLVCRRIEVDEMWSYCQSKEQQAWVWIALCPDSKLVTNWCVGPREAHMAKTLIADLAARTKNRVQLTSDGLRYYADAVEESFGDDIDFAMLVKIYDEERKRRYKSAAKNRIIGNPDPDLVSTSLIERQNLTLRMSCKRFARRTNAFSKKIENHAAAVALHFMYYNFCRIHGTLRMSPAMAAGVCGNLWSLEDVVRMIDFYFYSTKK